MSLPVLKKMKLNSLFYRTFLLLMILSLFLSGLFFALVHYFVHSNLKENLRGKYEENLISSVQASDALLAGAETVLSQMSHEVDLVNAGILPGIDDVSHYERNVRVLRILESFRSFHEEISNVCLLENEAGEAYYSEDTVYKASTKPEQDLPWLRELQQHRRRIGEEPYHTVYVGTVGGKPYLSMDFLPAGDSFLSTLVLELDPKRIFGEFADSAEGRYAVYDGEGRAMTLLSEQTDGTDGDPSAFMQEEKSMRGTEFTQDTVARLQTLTGVISSAWDGDILALRAALSGWLFVSEYRPESIPLQPLQVLLSILPLLLFFWLISFAAAFAISTSISRPISGIVQSMKERDEAAEARFHSARNELEFLQSEYESSSQKEQKMERILRHVTPELTEKYMGEILSGRRKDPTETAHMLKEIGSGFSLDGRYSVLAVGWDSNMPSGYAARAKQVILDSAAVEDAACIFLPRETEQVFVLEWSCEKADIPHRMRRIGGRLSATAANWRYPPRIGESQIYDSFANISCAYQDAHAGLEAELTAAEDRENGHGAGESERISQHEASDRELTVKTAHLLRSLERGDFDRADALFPELESAAGQQQLLRELQAFAERHDLETGDIGENEKTGSVYPKLRDAFRESYDKRQNKYIVAATAYVGQHFAESSLSLGDVADALGINRSYLSKLFNENLQLSFTDYTNGIRIQRARELLRDSGLSIAGIAAQTGFNTMQHFNKVFKKQVGMTPGQYRKSL